MLRELDPPAAQNLCSALQRSFWDEDIWIYYAKSSLVPCLRSAELRQLGCAIPILGSVLDWAGYSSDIHDPRRATLIFARQGISRHQVARVAIALLIFANVAFAAVGRSAILLGAVIAALSLLYSCSPSFGKRTPIVGSINHLLGGALHFLLGYTLCHALDASGLVISLFFGLVFAGGHLNHEVRDYEGDLLNGIRTSAVVFGCRRTFLASLCTFTAAYAILAGLAALGILPRLLLWSPIVWLLHVAWSLRALQRGLGFETASWMQRRYRLLFALLGLAMLAR
jgi:4-hydroxybenzoate polyprenyltransferase